MWPMTAVNTRWAVASPKGSTKEAVELTFPFETEVGDGVLPHMLMMVGRGNIHSATIIGVAE